ncbi:hypothetical protein CROQUDRAFT_101188 [Cronartium quercuum f. sp. fusiforme G11]|uniref:Uncharacterized protein n=1 Tax=Cronartium quercuum f. sp. fusiforme G11 TaxID=708437 RepID=A0A9P6N630_9BASI|nr:hypothetical protein CROQUDRAFT_101188 [Cronartium quercuum f. sp. fusiforme G11]
MLEFHGIVAENSIWTLGKCNFTQADFSARIIAEKFLAEKSPTPKLCYYSSGKHKGFWCKKYYTPGAFPGTPSTTKPHAAVTEANACTSSLELGGEHVVINHRAPPSQ